VELARLDDHRATEAVPDEDKVGGADTAEERAAGEDIEDAFFEVVGFAVVNPEDGDQARGKEGGEARVQVIGRAIDAAHGAADANNRACPAFDGMEDGVNVAAGGFEAEAEGATLFIKWRSGHAEEAQGEVLGFGFGVVPHHPGHREPPAERD